MMIAVFVPCCGPGKGISPDAGICVFSNGNKGGTFRLDTAFSMGSVGATSEVTGRVAPGMPVPVGNREACGCEMAFGGPAGADAIAEPLEVFKNVAIAVVGFASN